MSDAPQGDGWWVASDGKYYSPEQHPEYVPPAPSNLPAVVPPAPTPAISEPQELPASEPEAPFTPLIDGTLWTGHRKGLAVRARYTVTHDRLVYESGRLGTKSEQFPLASIKDIDIRQSMVQKSRGWGDVLVHFDESRADRKTYIVENVVEFRELRDLLDRLSKEARYAEHHRANTQTINYGAVGSPPPTPGIPPIAPAQQPSAAPTLIAQELKGLAELRDVGVLSEEEFQAQKSRLLGG